jgi:hypothetical protein
VCSPVSKSAILWQGKSQRWSDDSDMTNYLGVMIFLVIFLGLIVWTLSAVAADARRRGKSPLLVVLVAVFFFPLGLILWPLFRPKPMDGGNRGFRLNDHRVQ